MRKIIYVILAFLFFSCKNRDEGLSEELYNMILNYQKEVNFSSQVKESDPFLQKYIYRVHFTCRKDTMITIGIENQGHTGSLNHIYGIYSDKNLYPTIIEDSSKIGKRFINEYRKKDLESFHNEHPAIVDIYTPVYFFKIKNKKIIFLGKE